MPWKIVIPHGSKLQFLFLINNHIHFHRFGTGVKKDILKDDWPLPGVNDGLGQRYAQSQMAQINVTSYTKGSKKCHNRKKTLFTT